MAFLAGVQTALGSVNEHCLVMWHSHTLPVTPKRFLLLQKASGEIAEAGFVAEMRTKGFSHFRQSIQFSSQFHKERRGGDLCRKKPSVWWFGCPEGRKKSFCLFLPWGECKGPPLLCLRLLLHMLTPANSSSTFSFMLNTMGILFCNEFYPVGISDMDS